MRATTRLSKNFDKPRLNSTWCGCRLLCQVLPQQFQSHSWILKCLRFLASTSTKLHASTKFCSNKVYQCTPFKKIPTFIFHTAISWQRHVHTAWMCHSRPFPCIWVMHIVGSSWDFHHLFFIYFKKKKEMAYFWHCIWWTCEPETGATG